jgi:hypothetical protein
MRQPPLAIRACACFEQRVERPLAIRDRRRFERRVAASASKCEAANFVPSVGKLCIARPVTRQTFTIFAMDGYEY